MALTIPTLLINYSWSLIINFFKKYTYTYLGTSTYIYSDSRHRFHPKYRNGIFVFRRSSERDRPASSSGTAGEPGGGGGSAGGVSAAPSSSAAIVVSQATDRHATSSAGGSDSNRDAIFRWRDRQYYGGPKRWLESALRDSTWQDKEDSNDANKKASGSNNAGSSSENGQSPLWLGDDLEFWPEKGAKEKVKFVRIAALHNELVAVSDKGHLYQWKWSDITPHR